MGYYSVQISHPLTRPRGLGHPMVSVSAGHEETGWEHHETGIPWSRCHVVAAEETV